jgi:hypothetical protein
MIAKLQRIDPLCYRIITFSVFGKFGLQVLLLNLKIDISYYQLAKIVFS